ncbi:MAG: hypothetical protein P8I97_13595 [Verrucomicrobiales bacterium]|nr:hypothetical protein [Verrucomicrobiales bacterium]
MQADATVPATVVDRHESWKSFRCFKVHPTPKTNLFQHVGVGVNRDIDRSTGISSTIGCRVIDVSATSTESVRKRYLVRVLGRHRGVVVARNIVMVALEWIVAKKALTFQRRNKDKNRHNDKNIAKIMKI